MISDSEWMRRLYVDEERIKNTVKANLFYLEVEEEKEIEIEGKIYLIDLFCPERGIAIELKTDRVSGVVRGIGQCKIYQKAGYSSILISPINNYPDHIIECYRDIGACLCSLDKWEIKPITRKDIYENLKLFSIS